MKSIDSTKDLFSLNQTDEILKLPASKISKHFYHYTTMSSAKKILTPDAKGNRFFFISNLEKMNDLLEASLHKSSKKKIYSFCTCCTRHEKIPLWYLYSGIRGQGARIGIPPGKMLALLNSIDTVYPVENYTVNYSKPLKKGTDFDFQCGWVYYMMDGHNRVVYKNDLYALNQVNDRILSKNYFIKSYPWEYEREFRIVIKNNNKDIKSDKLALKIPDSIIPYFEIMCAPEIRLTQKRKDEFIRLGIKPNRIKKSKLKIKMNLIENNEAEINSWYKSKERSKAKQK